MKRVYQAGERYSNADVMLPDLRQPGKFTDDILAMTHAVASDRLMSALNGINDLMAGRAVPRTSAEGGAENL
ncbi:hypothetical protein A0O30_00450 [Pseudomonas sp. LLC-1]|nr:hypothetical protein A0O30_00450 [Pseudomonas sp. LLC-1]